MGKINKGSVVERCPKRRSSQQQGLHRIVDEEYHTGDHILGFATSSNSDNQSIGSSRSSNSKGSAATPPELERDAL